VARAAVARFLAARVWGTDGRVPQVEALREEGHEVCGVLAICDRLAGGAAAIEEAAGAPFVALTTIDEVYPDRPDRD